MHSGSAIALRLSCYFIPFECITLVLLLVIDHRSNVTEGGEGGVEGWGWGEIDNGQWTPKMIGVQGLNLCCLHSEVNLNLMNIINFTLQCNLY